jgi:ATP-binding cassette subfamily B protein
VDPMISSPGFRFWYPEDEVSRQQVRPGTARRIWPYLRQYRGPITLLLGVTAVNSAVLVASPLILRLIIDDGILRHRESVIVTLALTVAGLALVGVAAGYVRSRYSQWIGESLVLELRTSVFRQVQRQSLAFFTRTQTGSLVSRIDGDIGATQRLVGVLMSESVSMLLNLVLVLTAMFWLSWQLSLLALAVIPLFMLPGKVASRRWQRLFLQQMQLHGELATMTAERVDVSGALLAKLYGRPDEDAELFTRKATRIRDLAVANGVGMELVMAYITLLAALVTALVYGLGGTLVIHGVFAVGTLVAFIALVSELYGPLSEMSHLPLEILTALVSFDRVFEILDLEPLITERPTAYPLTQTGEAPGVEVAGVWFRYPAADQVSLASLEPAALTAPERPGDAWVLRDVSFTAESGKLTALVGLSGAGKTTITHLVPRLYDPVRGAVRIGGHDIRDLTLESLRSVVGVVPQDAHLFHDTIRANLLYARPSATEKELTEACQGARIWELISSLPDGLDTIAGDRGYRFSGGEKQRLALARLLLKAPSVVVLDEATAHLDSESEVAIQRALATALAGRTSLVIAHRLSTVRAADQILVIDGGQIAERGTHDELLAAGGVYAGLYRTQFAPQAALPSILEEGRAPFRLSTSRQCAASSHDTQAAWHDSNECHDRRTPGHNHCLAHRKLDPAGTGPGRTGPRPGHRPDRDGGAAADRPRTARHRAHSIGIIAIRAGLAISGRQLAHHLLRRVLLPRSHVDAEPSCPQRGPQDPQTTWIRDRWHQRRHRQPRMGIYRPAGPGRPYPHQRGRHRRAPGRGS